MFYCFRLLEKQFKIIEKSCKPSFLCQPSSTAAEKVFSIVKHSFGDQQLHTLEDNLEVPIILQYTVTNV